MKKITQIFQKSMSYIGIICFALLFIYALGMATPTAPCKLYEETRNFYKVVMPYNDMILWLSIGGLFISVLYPVFRNHVRPVYYVTNFVWFGVYSVYTVIASILSMVGILFYQNQYGQLPFEAMNQYWIDHQSVTRINPNTCIFALGFVVCILLLVTLIPVGFILFDKIKGRINYEKNRKNGIPDSITHIACDEDRKEA